ncbi:MAG: hypothetical protein AABY18_01020 [Candidatus Thermoplasmatota archaeon]
MKTTAWCILLLLALVPLAVAQGPPSSHGPPTSTPSGSPPSDAGNVSSQDRPSETPSATGQPTSMPSTGPREPAVDIQDAQGGFGARPSDPDSRRPSFSYNASRAEIALDHADARVLDTVIDAIIEFQDEDGDGAYDLGETIHQRLALSDLPSSVHDAGDSTRDAVYEFPNGGNLTLRFHLAPTGDGEATKFDVAIHDFPVNSTTSRIAVGLRVEALEGLRVATVHGAPALVGNGTGQVPFLSWAQGALVDGQQIAVASSIQLDAGGPGAVIYWAYPQGEILHDPILGMTSFTLPSLGDPVVFAVALGAGVVFLAVGFEARRRYKP